MWDDRDENGQPTLDAWPVALRKMTMLLAEIKGIPPMEAARLVWIEGTEVLGFPVGWAMSGSDIELVKEKVGELIKRVQLKHTNIHREK